MSIGASKDAAEWTLAKVLAMCAEQQRTGILEVGAGDSVHRVHMRRGQVVYAEHRAGTKTWPLGEYLIESGTIDPQTLLEAKEKCEVLEIELEEYLIDKKLVSEDVLKRFADLHVAEVLFPLFLRTNLNLRFLDERPSNPRLVTALPVAYVLKEADRRAELWPELRRRVGSPRAVYSKDPSVLAELLGYVSPPEDEQDRLPEISAGARMVFFYVNGKKTVEQVARASGLGVFETYRAVAELLDAYLLQLETHEGPGEQPERRGRSRVRVVTILTWLVLAGLLGLGVQWIVVNRDTLATSLTAGVPEVRALVDEANVHQIDRALQLYHVQRGEYPESLNALVDEGFVGHEVVDSLRRIGYERLSAGYRLQRRP